MIANNLNALKVLLPVASAKVNSLTVNVEGKVFVHHVTKAEFVEKDLTEVLWEVIVNEYNFAVLELQENINNTFAKVYGRPLNLKQRVSEIISKFKEYMNKSGKSFSEITEEIQKYFKAIMGYNPSFSRNENGRLIPVTGDRIYKAYELMQQKKSIAVIEDALYL